MSDLIDRQAAIDVADAVWSVTGDKNVAKVWDQIKDLPSAQPDNQVHLCDSCKYTYPECPSGSKDVIYGNGKGNDNICACNKYAPSAQPKPERKNGKWLQKEDPFGFFEEIPVCSECGHTTEMRRTYNFCPHCGARMEVEE